MVVEHRVVTIEVLEVLSDQSLIPVQPRPSNYLADLHRRPSPHVSSSTSLISKYANCIVCIFHQYLKVKMVRRAKKFTPEVLLSAPRRSPGVPNSNGSKILYSVSTYSFTDHSRTSEIKVLYVDSKETFLVTDASGASEPNWINDSDVLLLTPGKKTGTTELYIGSPKDWAKTKYLAGTVNGPASNIKLKELKEGDGYIIALTAPAKPDGSIYNEADAPKKNTSGMVYDSVFVRHWDTYVTPIRDSIWFGTLSKSKGSKYELSGLTNALVGTRLQCPIPPFGGSSDYDISVHGIAFVAKDPDLDPSTHTRQNLYIGSWKSPGVELESLWKLPLSFSLGATSNPTFSNDGYSVAFTSMEEDGYEADRNQLYLLVDIRGSSEQAQVLAGPTSEFWDRSVSSINWGPDDKYIYVTADDLGNIGLFEIEVYNAKAGTKVIISEGGISDVSPLSDGRIFVSGSSLIDNSIYYIIDPASDSVSAKSLISSYSNSGSAFGLSPSQIDQFTFQGYDSPVHAWMVKPSSFSPDKKYPLAYLIHGGPQGAWENAWSTRWNPAVFAEQGYVVICPNPTGSTGYGQRFTDAIKQQWGGTPYFDLELGITHIEENLPFIDMDRAVALGASYGGYMMNWIQGHPLGRKFKALVTHDGVFSMAGQLASEEQYFPIHEFGGKKFMEDPDAWLQWDPAKFAKNWATPHLIIHSEKDYRLTISEGLSAFNVLQQNGVPSRLLVFPDENHWVIKPENSLLWHAVVLGWINRMVDLPDYPQSDNKIVRKLLEDAQMSM
jgi:dipeptidyl aminopeptidase/acylaminoacyl peptidase